MKFTAIYLDECPEELKGTSFHRAYIRQDTIHRLKWFNDDMVLYVIIQKQNLAYSLFFYSKDGRQIHAFTNSCNLKEYPQPFIKDLTNPEIIPTRKFEYFDQLWAENRDLETAGFSDLLVEEFAISYKTAYNILWVNERAWSKSEMIDAIIELEEAYEDVFQPYFPNHEYSWDEYNRKFIPKTYKEYV